jgi:hypothetical protein
MLDNESIILGGDWNLALDPKIYTNHGHVYRCNSRQAIQTGIKKNYMLNDIFRELHTGARKYTLNSLQRSRLVYFLISEDPGSVVENADISPGYLSDHSLVHLTLKTNTPKGHRPFWKFNNSLLRDQAFVDIVKQAVIDLKKQYAVPVYDFDNIQSISEEELCLTIHDQLFLDVLLMEIRSKCISYSVYKKKNNLEKEKKLMADIRHCESDLHDNNIELLNQYKQDLQKLRQKRLEGMIIRSRARWISDGEHNTKYFCRMEKRNFVQKAMNFLEKEDGSILHDPNAITKEVQKFYEKLYSKQGIDMNDIDLDDLDHSVLTDEMSNDLEGLITMAELTTSVKNLKNDKSPGSDGFTSEFFKFFFSDLKQFMLRSINCGFLRGEMSTTQRQGIITCIPKEGKDKRYIKNWRPITLLNTMYKLASSCIADRLKRVLPEIIHHDQQGFMKNRNIGENLRLLYDTLVYTKEKEIPGLLLSIDFFKAFDCVSWSFIQKALTKFNFGNDIKKWVFTFYSNITSCVHVNGQYSKWFSPERGTRQGDPLSPYLFLICAEIMAIMIRENITIKGIKIDGNSEIKISQFADDTTLFLDGTKESFLECIKALTDFSSMSGLIINYEKSCAVWIGASAGSKVIFLPQLKLSWNPIVFKSLGVKFSINIKDIVQINYEDKLLSIRRILNSWSRRNLTPFGRITVIKTLAMSKLTYLFLNIPDPSDKFLDELQGMFFNFLWSGKKDKIKRQSTYQSYEEGGLKMINVKAYLSSLKITWLKRILSNDGKITEILNQLCPCVKVIEERGGEFANVLMQRVRNPYWHDVFKHYKKISDKVGPTALEDFASECIHYNVNIRVNSKTFYNANWAENGIIYIKHLMRENIFLSYQEFTEKYPNIRSHFLMYEGLIQSIKFFWNKYDIKIQLQEDMDKPVVWKCFNKGSKHIYNCILDKAVPLKCIQKWSGIFEDNIDASKIFKHIKKATSDTHLRWFQYKLIYRLIPTQRFLHLRKIVDSSRCTFCGNQEETLDHLFWECPVTQIFWKDFTEWLHSNFSHSKKLILSKRLVIFGCSPNVYTDMIFDLLLLVAKYSIFCAKTRQVQPHLQSFINTIKQRFVIERQIAISNQTYPKFISNWTMYWKYFDK